MDLINRLRSRRNIRRTLQLAMASTAGPTRG
jgi:hypothetical protein